MHSALRPLRDCLGTSAAWWAPYRETIKRILHNAAAASVAHALNVTRDDRVDVQFVEQSALSVDEPYEAFIHRTSCVPTRDNLHDLFNGVMWLTYPRTKRRLNVLQAQQLSQHGVSGSRGPLRDALTLFDENAALLAAPTTLVDALRRRDWRALFLEQRELWRDAQLVVFGHALMEKLMQPRKAITAHVWVVERIDDTTMAASLDPDRLAAKSFVPLPVLGVPSWWDANAEPGFYEDAEVFRPSR